MEVENENRIGSIRVESSSENQRGVRQSSLAMPALIERAFVTHESSARADLAYVEPEDVALEIHHKPSRLNNQNANDEAFSNSALVDQR